MGPGVSPQDGAARGELTGRMACATPRLSTLGRCLRDDGCQNFSQRERDVEECHRRVHLYMTELRGTPLWMPGPRFFSCVITASRCYVSFCHVVLCVDCCPFLSAGVLYSTMYLLSLRSEMLVCELRSECTLPACYSA